MLTPEQEIYYLKILVTYLLNNASGGRPYSDASMILVKEAIKKLELKTL